MSDTIIEKIRKYCSEHPELVNSGIIKGVDPNTRMIVLEKNGVKKQISIDEIEDFDFDKFEEKKQETSEEMIESLDESEVYEKVPSNLDEIQQCINFKNEKLIDKALQEFAIDSTGKININKAIKVVTDNSVENIIECLRDNKKLPTSLSSYDITGKCIDKKENDEQIELENLINLSFKNILIYVEAAKLKNINFTEEQVLIAKDKYKTQVNDKLNILGLNKEKEVNNIIEEKRQDNKLLFELKPDTNIKRAGFADIIILTVIVLIYAAIIINLIMKLR